MFAIYCNVKKEKQNKMHIKYNLYLYAFNFIF